MCGIVGAASFSKWGITHKDRQIFQDLLIADSLRGKDGTGTIIIDDEGEARTLKIGDEPFFLLRDKGFGKFFERGYAANVPSDLVLIGHNRAASVGAVSTENAHPHVHGHITLVHNGTIRNYSRLPWIDKAEVDSMALTHAIAELGIDEAIKLTHGSYAIVYHDAKENTLNFLRNTDRPLTIAYNERERQIYWASEAAMLIWILSRHNVTGTEIAPLKTDTLVSFPLDEDRRLLESPARRRVAGPPITSYFRGQTYNDYADGEAIGAAQSLAQHGIEETRAPSLPKVITNAARDALNRRIATEKDKKQLPALLDATGKVIDIKAVPTKKARKTIGKALSVLSNSGKPAEIVRTLGIFKKGETLGFVVKDYYDAREPDSFIVVAESSLLANTVIKFRIEGLDSLEECFTNTKRTGEIQNIVKYPHAKGDEYAHCVWVNNVERVPELDVDTKPVASVPWPKMHKPDTKLH